MKKIKQKTNHLKVTIKIDNRIRDEWSIEKYPSKNFEKLSHLIDKFLDFKDL